MSLHEVAISIDQILQENDLLKRLVATLITDPHVVHGVEHVLQGSFPDYDREKWLELAPIGAKGEK